MKIAFFDSGMGGLSVLHHAMKVLPHEEFIFYADEDNVPYGTKSTEDVQRFVGEAFDFLLKQDVKAIVVACNTATSVAVAEMRKHVGWYIQGVRGAAQLRAAINRMEKPEQVRDALTELLAREERETGE